MMDFLSTAYGKIAAVCVALGVLWSGTKALGALAKWCKNRLTARRERLAAPEKTFALLTKIRKESEDMDALQASQLDALSANIDGLKQALDMNREMTSCLMNEKLNWSYVNYGLLKRPIPMQTRNSLEKMYFLYKSDKDSHGETRNHVPADWLEKIRSAPAAEAS